MTDPAHDKRRYVQSRNLSNPERSTIILALAQFAETRSFTVAKSERHRAILDQNVATAKSLQGYFEEHVNLTITSGES